MIVFHDMIADILINKKPNPIVTHYLWIRDRKLKIFHVFFIQFDFSVQSSIRLNSTQYLLCKF